VVVNVTSSATLARMPLASAYTASKMAIEGFTGSLAFELEAFDVRVKLVEPGYGPTTSFTSNGGPRMQGLVPEAYEPFAKRIFAAYAQPAAVTTESDVAEVVWRAANDADWAAPISSGCRRVGAGAVEMNDSSRRRSSRGSRARDAGLTPSSRLAPSPSPAPPSTPRGPARRAP
jgi:hypothetical protein